MSFKSRIKPANSVWMEDAKLKNMIICQPEVCKSLFRRMSRTRFMFIFFSLSLCLYIKCPCRTETGLTKSLVVSSCDWLSSSRGPIATFLGEWTFLSALYAHSHWNAGAKRLKGTVADSFFPFFLWLGSKSLPWLVHVDDILFRKPVEIGSLLYFSSQVVFTQGQYVMVRVSAEVVHPESGQHDLTNVFHFTLKSGEQAPEVIPRSYQGALPISGFLERSLSRKGHPLFFFGFLQRQCFTSMVVAISWTRSRRAIHRPRQNFKKIFISSDYNYLSPVLSKK